MPKITFSYIFKDSFHRVVEAFIKLNSNLSLSVNNLISNLIFTKGNYFNEEESEFSFCWKNYYKLNIIVEKVINEQLFIGYTHKTLNIDKLPIQLKFIFNFFWDKINEQTIFIYILEFQDEFFTDLIKTDFNEKDKLNLCKQIEDYLSISIKGLERSYTCILNANLKQTRKYLLYPKLFFKIMSKDLIKTNNDHEVYIDEKYELFTNSDESSDLISLAIFKVESLIMTEFYGKVVYITSKKTSFPSSKFTFILRELANNKPFFLLLLNLLNLLHMKLIVHFLIFGKKGHMNFGIILKKTSKNLKK